MKDTRKLTLLVNHIYDMEQELIKASKEAVKEDNTKVLIRCTTKLRLVQDLINYIEETIAD